jgi:hypothetical protein
VAIVAKAIGKQNKGDGYQALYSNTTGSHNPATGFQALLLPAAQNSSSQQPTGNYCY